jgi:LysM repeat protein
LTITDLPKEYYGKMISIKNNNEEIVSVKAKNNVLETDKLKNHQKLILECVTCEQKIIKLETDFQIPNRHTVKKDQFLSDIEQIFGIKVDSIKRWNKLKDDNIREGRELLLVAPTGGSTTGGSTTGGV